MNKKTLAGGVFALVIVFMLLIIWTQDTQREAFVRECASTNEVATTEVCGCMYDDLESQVGEDGIRELDQQYQQTQVLPPEADEAINRCITQHYD